MARQRKSIKQPEHGYAHRDHRSKKTRENNAKYKRFMRIQIRKKKESVYKSEDNVR